MREPIAIIGLGCVLPDAPDVDTFWNNLTSGKDSIREVDPARWDPALYYDADKAADKTYAKIGAFVTDDGFNGLDYRMPPNAVDQIDACQRWALAATRQALKDAGLATGLKGDEGREFDRDRTAVILGNAMGGETNKIATKRLFWPEAAQAIREDAEFAKLPAAEQEAILSRAETRYKSTTLPVTEDTMPGHLANVAAGRVANVFNLAGKNFTTDAACASSLAALDAACATLASGEADMVVCGGTDRSMDVTPYVQFSAIGALSPDGSRPFDKGANGFVMGEGCAIFLLKRVADAERDGDHIYAVVRGIGGSSDGKGKGITAPNPVGQVKAVRRAYADAGIDPSTVGYLEAHGTSTPVGDPVELQSVINAFDEIGATAPVGSIRVGSVKSNIGHLKAAAGAAGLLKATLAIDKATIPASINVKELNPRIEWDASPFRVATETQPWDQEPRVAAISSFGFGGTNFHVVVEQYQPGTYRVADAASTQTVAAAAPATFDAAGFREHMQSAAGLEAEAVVLAESDAPSAAGIAASTFPETGDGPRLRDKLAPLTQTGLTAERRVAFHVDDPSEIGKKLALAAKAAANPAAARLAFNQGVFLGEGAPQGKVAFLFPGQGTQYVNMGRDLAQKYEVVRATFEEADKILFDELGGIKLTDILWPTPNTEEAQKASNEKLKLTEFTQPAVLAMDVAILRLVRQWGVEADVVAGHSLGEYGALVAAGVMSFESALHAVAARGREMASVDLPDLGKMASISADWHVVEEAIRDVEDYVICANKNCPSQTVIAGSSAGVEAAVEKISAQGIQTMFLPVSAAFHSDIVAPASGPLRNVLARLPIESPKVRVITNVGAADYPTDPEAIRDNLAVQVASPVAWTDTLEKMYADGVRTFIEIGPKRALTGFVMDTLQDKPDIRPIFANHPKKGGVQSINELFAFLGASGFQPNLAPLEDASVYTAGFIDPTAAFRTAARPVPASSASAAAPTQPASELSGLAAKVRELAGEIESLRAPTSPVATPAPAAPVASTPDLDAKAKALGLCLDDIGISGISVGLPGAHKPLFDDGDWDRILAGENLITPLSEEARGAMVDKNIVRLVKSAGGQGTFQAINDMAQVIHLAARRGDFDLKDWGVGDDLLSVLDKTSQYAIAAGLEALRDAGIPLQQTYIETSTGGHLPKEWKLPKPLRDGTGIIFASAFPGYDNLVDEMSRHLADKYAGRSLDDLQVLYNDLVAAIDDEALRGKVQTAFDSEFARLQDVLPSHGAARYEFNRKFLFSVLSMGHSQLAQFLGARGPNTQVNAACASTTQAIGIANDWIRTGRCRRVLVVGADDATSPNMMEWIGAGFLASGAATTKSDVTEAALPFDARRHGMIIGMGAVGILVEAEPETEARGMRPVAHLLATTISNSAFHGSRLDVDHIAAEMQAVVGRAAASRGTTPEAIAASTVFMSHETYTPARGGSAAAEIHALRATFGAAADKVVVANTKGFTGHPQGAGIEDAVVLKALQRGQVPPIPHLKQPDPELGDLNLSQGGSYDVRYGLRLAAGFGSQVAMTVTELAAREDERIADAGKYAAWLGQVSGIPGAATEIVDRTLRIVDQGPPSKAPAPEPVVVEAAPVAVAEAPVVVGEDPLITVTNVVAEKTGYPTELLEADLDLEADLGIDTVKQAELFGELREHFGVPLDESLKLSDYNTLRKVAEYMAGEGSRSEPSADTSAPQGELVPTSTSGDALATVTAVVAEKTGYPTELLEADLDLEADLGIDTVKQAELFGELREHFGVPLDESLSLADYNTLRKVADYMRGGSTVAPAPSPVPPTPAAEPPAVAESAPAAAPATDDGAALAKVTEVVAEKTGYPVELLEPDLDLEADLGIDTVKQAELFGELREHFGVPLDESLSLADYNTLRKVADYMSGGSSVAPAAAPGPMAEAIPAPAPRPAAAAPAAPSGDALAKVTEVVAEKTGYPTDLLEPDLDLEADLGIDTVKQAELFGELREHFGVPLDESLSLADYNTLRKVADYMGGNASAAPTPAEAAPVATPEPAASGIRRLVPQPIAAPSPNITNPVPQGPVTVLGGPLPDAFAAAGWTTAEAGDDPVGLLVWATKPGAVTPRQVFDAAKANADSLRVICLVTANDGAHGLVAPRDATMAGLAGIAKALRKELPDCLVKAIDLHPSRTDAALAVNELATGGPATEVCFDADADRHTIAVVADDLAADGFDVSDKTIVVSGGAQGITAELVAQLAPQAPRLVLLGRTDCPPDAQTWAGWSDDEWKAEQGRAVESLKAAGETPTPVKVTKLVDKKRKAAEVWTTCKHLESLGAQVEYGAVDVTDADAVKAALDAVRAAWGPIHGVVHAAGMEISKQIRDKPESQFDLVYSIKTVGLENLLEATADDPLELLAGFGSVAGRFGNLGQTDYSAANEAMAKRITQVAQARGIPTAFTIAWGPWGEIGMATRGGIMTVLEASGVTPIPTADGIAAWRAELSTPGVRECVVAGELGMLDIDGQILDSLPDPRAAALADRMAAAPERFRLLSGIKSVSDDAVTATLVMDRAVDPYVDDHAIDGTPLLPGVFGIEAFCETASLLADDGTRFLGADSVQFLAPLKQHKGPVAAQVTATRTDAGTFDCSLTSQFLGPDGKPLGEPKTHFTARVRFGSPDTQHEPIGQASADYDATGIYPPFFHGPSFQVLADAGDFDDEVASATACPPQGPVFAAGEARLASEPFVSEALFQLCGLHTLVADETMSLPSAIERLQVFPRTASAPLTGNLRLHARATGRTDDGRRRFDAVAADAEGNVVVSMSGYAMVELGPGAAPTRRNGVADTAADAPTGTAKDTSAATPTAVMTSKTIEAEDPIPVPELDGISIGAARVPAQPPTSDARLSARERSQVLAFDIPKRACEWGAGRLAAKRAARRAAPELSDDDIAVDQDPGTGEPILMVRGERSPAKISITHSDGIALAAIANETIGIDTEPVEERGGAWWDQSFGSDEIDHIRSQGNDELASTAAWCAKEACLKRAGTGLRTSLHDVRVMFRPGGATVRGPWGDWGVQFYDADGRVLAVTAESLD